MFLTTQWGQILVQVCNHPYLFEAPVDQEGCWLVDDRIVSECGKMQVSALLPVSPPVSSPCLSSGLSLSDARLCPALNLSPWSKGGSKLEGPG